jgi:hypothetical protein
MVGLTGFEADRRAPPGVAGAHAGRRRLGGAHPFRPLGDDLSRMQRRRLRARMRAMRASRSRVDARRDAAPGWGRVQREERGVPERMMSTMSALWHSEQSDLDASVTAMFGLAGWRAGCRP